MQISDPLRRTLAEHGVTTLRNGSFQLPDRSVFEPPCSIKQMQAVGLLEMGAFSFAESGYYYGVKIGRLNAFTRSQKAE